MSQPGAATVRSGSPAVIGLVGPVLLADTHQDGVPTAPNKRQRSRGLDHHAEQYWRRAPEPMHTSAAARRMGGWVPKPEASPFAIAAKHQAMMTYSMRSVRRDVGKPPHRGDGAGVFEGVEHQDGAEHDPEHGHRDHQPPPAGGRRKTWSGLTSASPRVANGNTVNRLRRACAWGQLRPTQQHGGHCGSARRGQQASRPVIASLSRGEAHLLLFCAADATHSAPSRYMK